MNSAERRAQTQAEIDAYGKKPKKVVPLRYPRVLESGYYKEIKRYTRLAIKAVNAFLVPQIPNIIAEGKRDLMLDSATSQIDLAMKQAIDEYNMAIRSTDLAYTAERYGNALAENNAFQMSKSFNAGLGMIPIRPEPWLTPMLDAFVANNVRLIKTVPERYFASVEQAIRMNVTNGASVATTKAAIMKAGNVSSFNAQRIARTETGKMFGELTKQRNEAVGITKFIWHHSHLPNPREDHLASDGKVYSWSKGNEQGDIPGGPINCRCSSSVDTSQFNLK